MQAVAAGGLRAVVSAVALALGLTGAAAASPIDVTLSSFNGLGTFDDSLPCPSGDGPSFRYAYSGTTTTTAGRLGGLWRGTFEVHDANAGTAFVPAGTGRLRIDGVHGGEASALLGQGGCEAAGLTLGVQPDGDPEVTGSLPFTVDGGTGPLRGLGGGGSADIRLELGAGADNVAGIRLTGDLTIPAPQLTGGSPSASYRGLVDFLGRRLTLGVSVRNAAGAGDAFDVRATDVRLGGRVAGDTTLGAISAGGASGTGWTFTGVPPGSRQTLTFVLRSRDALDGTVAAVPVALTFTTPSFPRL